MSEDPTLRALRAAVFADPDADAPRMVYADYLQSLGDPRGELIALQLERARARTPITERERFLVELVGATCAEPLTPHLTWYELSRGFVSRCAAGYGGRVPAHVANDPAWSTVEALASESLELLASPHVRARRLHTSGNELPRLASGHEPAPYEVIVGAISPDTPVTPRGIASSRDGALRRGVWIADDAGWATVMAVGSLRRLRVLSLMFQPMGEARVAPFLHSPLGEQLQHLDVYCSLPWNTPDPWRAAFDRAALPILTISLVLAGAAANWNEPDALVALERTRRDPQLRIQLRKPLRGDKVTQVVRVLGPLGRGLDRIEVNDVAEPDRVEQRHHELVGQLRKMFSRVVARAGADLTP